MEGLTLGPDTDKQAISDAGLHSSLSLPSTSVRHRNLHFADGKRHVKGYIRERALSLDFIEWVVGPQHAKFFAGSLLSAAAFSMWSRESMLVGDWFNLPQVSEEYPDYENVRTWAGLALIFGSRIGRCRAMGVVLRWWLMRAIGNLRESVLENTRESEWIFTFPKKDQAALYDKISEDMGMAEGVKYQAEGSINEYKTALTTRPALQNDATEDARCAIAFARTYLIQHLSGKRNRIKKKLLGGLLSVLRKVISDTRNHRPASGNFYYSFGCDPLIDQDEWVPAQDGHTVGLVTQVTGDDTREEKKKKEHVWEKQFCDLVARFPQLTVYMHYQGKVTAPNLNLNGQMNGVVFSKPTWQEMEHSLRDVHPAILRKAIPEPPIGTSVKRTVKYQLHRVALDILTDYCNTQSRTRNIYELLGCHHSAQSTL